MRIRQPHFYITTYKVKNLEKTFQTYELKTEQGTLFLRTFPTKHRKFYHKNLSYGW